MKSALLYCGKIVLQVSVILFVLAFFSKILAGDLSKTRLSPSELVSYSQYVHQIPEPIGGLSAITTKINYPEIAGRARIQGDVYVRVFVNEQGIVTNTQLVKGLSGGCDEAVLKAIDNTRFAPALMNDGTPVKAQTILRIRYRLYK
ncbi:MAG: energy transducer TonB [Bacteroidota bacterium]|nr:energy transducer TonB [Bacteroidota bacterium]MDP4194500.1 energy transducer TonB [Bacteroidota bacterium]